MTRAQNLQRVALMLICLAIGLHGYLAYHHYQAAYGSAEPSICSINSRFDCDAVNASSYSTLFGMPVALYGAMTNLALLGLVLGAMVLEAGTSERWHRFAIFLSAVTVAASLVMGSISIFLLGTYCLFCLGLYVISFILTPLLIYSYSGNWVRDWQADFGDFKNSHSTLLIFLLLIPFGAWVSHQYIFQSFGGAELNKYMTDSLNQWRHERQFPLSITGPVLALGAQPETAKVRIVEFADFLCPHCKDAAPKLQNFVQSHPDARLEALMFPLDGACNPAFSQSSGLRCLLSKISYCTTVSANGWAVYEFIFSQQSSFRAMSDVERVLKPKLTQLGVDWTQLMSCVEDAKTHQAIVERSRLGSEAGVEGTPAIFVNGRLLMGGQFLPLLEQAYQEAKKSKP